MDNRAARAGCEHGSGERLQGSVRRSAPDTPVMIKLCFESVLAFNSSSRQGWRASRPRLPHHLREIRLQAHSGLSSRICTRSAKFAASRVGSNRMGSEPVFGAYRFHKTSDGTTDVNVLRQPDANHRPPQLTRRFAWMRPRPARAPQHGFRICLWWSVDLHWEGRGQGRWAMVNGGWLTGKAASVANG